MKGAPPSELPAAAAAVAAVLGFTAAASPIMNEPLLWTEICNEWSREICSSCTSL